MFRILTTVTLATVAVFLLQGCAGGSSATDASSQKDPGQALQELERDFRPSDHEPDPSAPSATSQTQPVPSDTDVSVPVGPPETVQGFRVQILSTTSIDSANARKAMAEDAFPTEWFYIDYEPPIYKVRGGNFLVRYDADRFARLLIDRGFPGSWTVPQRVLKNPPPPPPRPEDPAEEPPKR